MTLNRRVYTVGCLRYARACVRVCVSQGGVTETRADWLNAWGGVCTVQGSEVDQWRLQLWFSR